MERIKHQRALIEHLAFPPGPGARACWAALCSEELGRAPGSHDLVPTLQEEPMHAEQAGYRQTPLGQGRAQCLVLTLKITQRMFVCSVFNTFWS